MTTGECRKFVFDSEDCIRRIQRVLDKSDRAARERAEMNRLFEKAGGRPYRTFEQFDFTLVKMLAIEGLVIKALLRDASEICFEFPNRSEMERIIDAWTRG